MKECPVSRRQPLVSFCIPTYNRSNFLKRLLNSIIEQESQLDYEVIVRDNASTDDTFEVFEAARNLASRDWRYYRNPENEGGLVNIRKCTDGALGKYICIIGDDDYFRLGAFEAIASSILAADEKGCGAIFTCGRFPSNWRAKEVTFEWLRYVSINVPAFITAVIWRSDVWVEYAYHAYPSIYSIPQLDCFVNYCCVGKVLACNEVYWVQTKASPSDRPDYWFYKRHALVDCFEYPVLYRKVLSSGKLGLWTRFMTQLRRFALIREIVKKLFFMSFNRDYYSPVFFQFSISHERDLHGFLVRLMWRVIDGTGLGRRCSEIFCERILRAERLPSETAFLHRF